MAGYPDTVAGGPGALPPWLLLDGRRLAAGYGRCGAARSAPPSRQMPAQGSRPACPQGVGADRPDGDRGLAAANSFRGECPGGGVLLPARDGASPASSCASGPRSHLWAQQRKTATVADANSKKLGGGPSAGRAPNGTHMMEWIMMAAGQTAVEGRLLSVNRGSSLTGWSWSSRPAPACCLRPASRRAGTFPSLTCAWTS
jgi:hypothetical protein